MSIGPNLKKFMNMFTKKQLNEARERLKDCEESISVIGMDFANGDSVAVEVTGHRKDGKIIITNIKEIENPYSEMGN